MLLLGPGGIPERRLEMYAGAENRHNHKTKLKYKAQLMTYLLTKSTGEKVGK